MVRLSSQFSPLGPVFRDVIANKNNVSSASDALEKAQAAKTSTTQTVAEINTLIDKATNAADKDAFLTELYSYLDGKTKLDDPSEVQ